MSIVSLKIVCEYVDASFLLFDTFCKLIVEVIAKILHAVITQERFVCFSANVTVSVHIMSFHVVTVIANRLSTNKVRNVLVKIIFDWLQFGFDVKRYNNLVLSIFFHEFLDIFFSEITLVFRFFM